MSMSNFINRDVIKSFGDQIALVDSNYAGLEMFCYTNCNNKSHLPLKACRGVVFEKNKLVFAGFPYTDIYNYDTKDIPDIENCKIFTSYEGSLLRLFHHVDRMGKERWYISTHKKLNAFTSKWGSSRSFGDILIDGIQYEATVNEEFSKRLKGTKPLKPFLDTLNKTRQYMIFLRNIPENRIVCEPPTGSEPRILHVGTYINGVLNFEDDIGLRHPEDHTFTSREEMLNYLDTMDYHKVQGLIFFEKNRNRQFKIFTKMYKEWNDIRGNQPSIKFRYLQLRIDPVMKEKLKQLYPNLVEVFERYEDDLKEIAGWIYDTYLQRYIRRMETRLPHDEYQVMQACHMWHKEDRMNNRLTYDKTLEFLNEQPPENLSRMLRRYRFNFRPDLKSEFRPDFRREFKPEYKNDYRTEYKNDYRTEYRREFQPDSRTQYRPYLKKTFRRDTRGFDIVDDTLSQRRETEDDRVVDLNESQVSYYTTPSWSQITQGCRLDKDETEE